MMSKDLCFFFQMIDPKVSRIRSEKNLTISLEKTEFAVEEIVLEAAAPPTSHAQQFFTKKIDRLLPLGYP